jgi:hypothetical protein
MGAGVEVGVSTVGAEPNRAHQERVSPGVEVGMGARASPDTRGRVWARKLNIGEAIKKEAECRAQPLYVRQLL